MSLTNGKPLSTAEVKNFVVTAAELCSIIKVCAQSNVKEFRFGDIFLVFGKEDQLPEPLDTVQTRPNEQEVKKIQTEVEAQNAAERVRDELENLKILDPLAYERLIEGEIDVGESP